MATPKAIVLRAAGVNCDRETEYALELAGFKAERIHVFRIMEDPAHLLEVQLLVVAGGFSYGDDVSAGKILANQMLHRLAEPLNRFVENGGLVLGICNGFQVLLKSGLLPGARVDPASVGRDATLTWNDSGRFVDRWVHLRVDSERCVFLRQNDRLALPIAHGEGKFVVRDAGVLDQLRRADQVALRYCDAEGDCNTAGFNPNGSVDNIAGLCDPTGRVLGLMPHPERFIMTQQHPQWTRRVVGEPDGLTLFRNAAAALG